MKISAERDQKSMDNATRNSISILVGGCLQRNVHIGALAGRSYSDLFAELSFQLDRDGKIIGEPLITASGGDEVAREIIRDQVLKALYLCDKAFEKLPKEHYDQWHK